MWLYRCIFALFREIATTYALLARTLWLFTGRWNRFTNRNTDYRRQWKSQWQWQLAMASNLDKFDNDIKCQWHQIWYPKMVNEHWIRTVMRLCPIAYSNFGLDIETRSTRAISKLPLYILFYRSKFSKDFCEWYIPAL